MIKPNSTKKKENKKNVVEIYIDNGATTQVDEKVIEAMLPFFTKYYGNASSVHHKGAEARKALSEARRIIASKINALPEEIIFTSGGSEGDNLAIKGIAYALKDKGKHIITSRLEHPAILETIKQLEKEGYTTTYLKPDKQGFINIDDLRQAIRKDTILVSIMHANNEIGVVQNIEQIGNVCHEKNVLLHTDCVQSFCKVPIDVKKMNIDLATFASHKIHGPKGVGALYVKRGNRLLSLIHGGSQEFKLRAGTENLPGIVGFAKAVELWTDVEIEQIKKLRNRLVESILKTIPNTELNGPKHDKPNERLCNNANISFSFIEGESILLYLDKFGICVSTGSACSSQSLEPSHVLLAIGVPHSKAHSTIRFSLSRFTTDKDIDYVVDKLKMIVSELRGLSPLKTEKELAAAENERVSNHH